MKIRPLHDRVIVKRMEEERTTPGGIVIPDAATEKPIKGEVIAAGNGKILENGDIRALDVKVGDKVLFGKYAGTEVKVEGEELLVGDRGLRTRYPIKLFNQAAGAAVDIRGNTHGC
jgi:chaperonin GroES